MELLGFYKCNSSIPDNQANHDGNTQKDSSDSNTKYLFFYILKYTELDFKYQFLILKKIVSNLSKQAKWNIVFSDNLFQYAATPERD